jgi:hypothetical protein
MNLYRVSFRSVEDLRQATAMGYKSLYVMASGEHSAMKIAIDAIKEGWYFDSISFLSDDSVLYETTEKDG